MKIVIRYIVDLLNRKQPRVVREVLSVKQFNHLTI